LVKKVIIVKNATAYTGDWYCHLVVDRASLAKSVVKIVKFDGRFLSMSEVVSMIIQVRL
jgi:hypothetical protein